VSDGRRHRTSSRGRSLDGAARRTDLLLFAAVAISLVNLRRRGRRPEPPPVDGLVLSGLAELAVGALTGWPYAIAIADPERARSLGIRSRPRMRQWHLDLIALGGLTVLAGTAVPGLPSRVAWPLGIGAWTNAMAFGVLTAWPDLHDHPAYRAGVIGSFVATSTGFVGLAAEGVRRRR
jgi:hypothetical protein